MQRWLHSPIGFNGGERNGRLPATESLINSNAGGYRDLPEGEPVSKRDALNNNASDCEKLDGRPCDSWRVDSGAGGASSEWTKGCRREDGCLYTPTRYIIAWQLCVSWILDYPWIRLRGGGVVGAANQPLGPLVSAVARIAACLCELFSGPPASLPASFSTWTIDFLLLFATWSCSYGISLDNDWFWALPPGPLHS